MLFMSLKTASKYGASSSVTLTPPTQGSVSTIGAIVMRDTARICGTTTEQHGHRHQVWDGEGVIVDLKHQTSALPGRWRTRVRPADVLRRLALVLLVPAVCMGFNLVLLHENSGTCKLRCAYGKCDLAAPGCWRPRWGWR